MTTPQPQQTSAQQRIAEASASASALYAASRVSTAATALPARAVLGTAAAVATAFDAATTAIGGLWSRLDPYDDAAVDEFAQQAGSVIVAAQRSVATATTAAQRLSLRSAGLDTPMTVSLPDDLRGTTVKFGGAEPVVHAKPKATVRYKGETVTVSRSDAAPENLFRRAVVTYRYERSKGADAQTADRLARERIDDLVDGNVLLAQRAAEQQTLRLAQRAHPEIVGYRRVIHPELSRGGVCGLCVAASDRIYGTEDLKPVHHRCKCGVLEVTADHDPGHRLNRDDLRMLYDDAGEKVGRPTTGGKQLKRTRYDVVHHAELGPTLTRVTGEKVPYYSVTPPATA